MTEKMEFFKHEDASEGLAHDFMEDITSSLKANGPSEIIHPDPDPADPPTVKTEAIFLDSDDEFLEDSVEEKEMEWDEDPLLSPEQVPIKENLETFEGSEPSPKNIEYSNFHSAESCNELETQQSIPTSREGEVQIRPRKKGSNFYCTVCNESFTLRSNCVRHMKLHFIEKPCKICGEKVKGVDVADHQKKHTKKEEAYMRKTESQYSCTICDSSFNSKHNCLQHIKNHIDTKIISCWRCGKRVKRKDFAEHIKMHYSKEDVYLQMNGPEFQCTICGSNFKTKHNCYKHIKFHLEDRACGACGKKFKREELAEHIKTHMSKEERHVQKNGSEFCCEICGCSFDKKNKCMRHISLHYEEKPCKICGFNANCIDLAEHMKTHTGKEGVSREDGSLSCCTICDSNFALKFLIASRTEIRYDEKMSSDMNHSSCSEQDLEVPAKRHKSSKSMLLQESDSQFNCSICDSVFAKESDCMDHIELHFEENPCKICGVTVATFDIAKHMKTHLDEEGTCVPKGGSEFSCHVCGMSFNRKSNLVRHLQIHSDNNLCKICGNQFNADEFDEHMKTHGGVEENYLRRDGSLNCCTFCGASFTHKSNCLRHIRIHIEDKLCEICDVKVKRIEYNEHMKIHSRGEEKYLQKSGSLYSCTVCNSSFDNKSNCMRHIKLHLKDKPCGVCGAAIKRDDMAEHMKLHAAEEEKYLQRNGSKCCCTICGASFDLKSNCTRHIKLHMEDRKCGVCGIDVKRIDMPEHMKTHSIEEEKYLQKNGSKSCCTICGFSSPLKNNCLRHIKIHTENKPCKVCGLKIKRADMTEHMKTHAGEEEKYIQRNGSESSCTICGAIFHHKPNCVRHVKLHLEDKKCEVCGIDVKRIDMPEHMKTHSIEEEKYLQKNGSQSCCTICGFTSPMRNNCLRHIKTHTEDKPCRVCGLKMKRADMTEHMKIHAGEEEKYLQKNGSEFRCTFCGASFDLKSNCTRHIKLHIEDKKCEVCGIDVKRIDMPEHMKTHAIEEEKYLQKNGSKSCCTICGFSSPLKNNCLRHIKIHTEDKPCKVCGLKIKRADMTEHMKTHAGEEEKYIQRNGSESSCTICGAIFHHKPNCVRHVKLHLEDKKCEVCGIDVKRIDIPEHMKTHSTEEEKYLQKNGSQSCCTICGFTSPIRNNCLRHIKTHTEDKPCRVCGLKMKRADMTEHMKIHAGEEEKYLQKNDSQFRCTFCGASFDLKSNCTRHIKLHIEDKKCEVCGIDVKRIDMPEHMKTHSSEEEKYLQKSGSQSSCTICGFSSPLKNNCLRHIKTHIEDKVCKVCGVTVKPVDMTEHVKTHSSEEEKYIKKNGTESCCTFCGASFPQKPKCVRHIKLHIEDKKCKVCGVDVKRIDMPGHMKTHSSEKYLQNNGSQSSCAICGASFQHRYNCLRHIKLHTEEKPCGECGLIFDRIELNQHMKTHATVEDEYVQKNGSLSCCSICGLSFKQKSNCKRHIRMHIEDKPCRICGVNFKRIDLIEHLKTHTFEEDKYVEKKGSLSCCTICGMSFKHKPNCTRHIKMHMKKKPCGECGLIFDRIEMIQHMKTHAGEEEKYVQKNGSLSCCSICGLSFKNKSNCTRHIRMHIEDKPCRICGVNFKRIDMMEHLKTHFSGEEENYLQKNGSLFCCTICGMSFNHKANCTRHIRTHIEEKQCRVCGISFKRMDLTEHLKTHSELDHEETHEDVQDIASTEQSEEGHSDPEISIESSPDGSPANDSSVENMDQQAGEEKVDSNYNSAVPSAPEEELMENPVQGELFF
ncbi:hypothetical protein QAD02_018063 [Eretmocerus hayati]|uniref:Uncharacterized protein n=1 Tax=Eretmocerus hayati TaxID=131215 RepID=A0ACC2PHJ0_9HYME|nr:hypothetical protein QAD02_018063 [Eretmocerus hayati]